MAAVDGSCMMPPGSSSISSSCLRSDSSLSILTGREAGQCWWSHITSAIALFICRQPSHNGELSREHKMSQFSLYGSIVNPTFSSWNFLLAGELPCWAIGLRNIWRRCQAERAYYFISPPPQGSASDGCNLFCCKFPFRFTRVSSVSSIYVSFVLGTETSYCFLLKNELSEHLLFRRIFVLKLYKIKKCFRNSNAASSKQDFFFLKKILSGTN